MTSVLGFVKRVYKVAYPPRAEVAPNSQPIRFGILGAAAIAPSALILPVRSHPEAVVYAVAARSLERAQAYAKKHEIEKVYGGPGAYQKLLDDPAVDAVYNPLPNGLHYEWTMKALQAGKHVLLEKPASNTAEEAREMFALAEAKGLVLLEAFHYRFHPAVLRAKEIIDSGELGTLKHAEVTMAVPRGFMKADDIRFNYDLGGGATMDMGCYTLNCLRYVLGAEPTEVLSATPDVFKPQVDGAMTATLAFPGDATGTMTCNLRERGRFGVIPRLPTLQLEVRGDAGELSMMNFVMPMLHHSITVEVWTGAQGKERKKRVEKVYGPKEGGKGEEWWSTYRWQLEAFVDKVKGRTPSTWVSAEDTVANMVWVEKVYEKSGLGVRPRSTFKLPVP